MANRQQETDSVKATTLSDQSTRKTVPAVRAWALVLFLPLLFIFVVVGDRLITHPNRQYLLLVFLAVYVAIAYGLEKLSRRKG